MKKLVLLSTAMWTLWSCNKSYVSPENEVSKISTTHTVYCGTVTTQNLMAGQHHLAGTVTVANDEHNVYVTYQTTGNWRLESTELFVGACDAMPVNKSGNPQIGHFPYKVSHTSGSVTTYTYTLPISSLPEAMCVAAHANVVKVDESGSLIQSETAWGEGTRFVTKGNWGMYFSYTIQECIEDTPVASDCYQTETAWSAGDRYVSKGNWATYTTYTGGTQTVNIYAGQHNLAGTVTFTPATSTSKVNVSINLTDGWELNDDSESVKIQGYSSIPAASNPAPGLFNTYKGTSTSLTLDMFNYYGIHLDVRKAVECE